MSESAAYLEQLVRETEQSEVEVMTQAMRAGLRQLWREWMLGRYLRGEITRAQAVEAVGLDWVDLAERQHTAMLEDISWGLNK